MDNKSRQKEQTFKHFHGHIASLCMPDCVFAKLKRLKIFLGISENSLF